MITIIVILSVLLCISIFTVINLLRKYETIEEDYDYMMGWIDKLNTQVTHILNQTKHIDRKGLFESDDEVGTIFKDLKDLINTLEKLVVKINE